MHVTLYCEQRLQNLGSGMVTLVNVEVSYTKVSTIVGIVGIVPEGGVIPPHNYPASALAAYNYESIPCWCTLPCWCKDIQMD